MAANTVICAFVRLVHDNSYHTLPPPPPPPVLSTKLFQRNKGKFGQSLLCLFWWFGERGKLKLCMDALKYPSRPPRITPLQVPLAGPFAWHNGRGEHRRNRVAESR